MINGLIHNPDDPEKVIQLLSLTDEAEISELYAAARAIRDERIGNKVYLRGLIEYSNRCSKNCYYCGIRSGNVHAFRYEVNDEEVLAAAKFAWENRYGSIVLQSGERSDRKFTSHISALIKKIHAATDNQLRITLSCGEQSEAVYREWYALGAQRYLLRIEASNPELYKKLHPDDNTHSYQRRLEALKTLVNIGYQTGTGVMIGLPFQTVEDLAGDLAFIRDSGVAMVGMGPYIEHAETPLFKFRDQLLPAKKRVELSLKMIAILRLMRPTINIASTTALQTLDPMGREKGLRAGANVIMPNLTPVMYKKSYDLYEGKPCLDDEPGDCASCIEKRIQMAGCKVAYGEWGDSAFYTRR
ncbi:MAG TPA: [FeFe] hydrogenase H-cluster radical SAM maturase HydE [Bacteroidales bacterium]|nr:[FeFe] hydrogenase H-cluster radical SAM maturase HydE [Bacteroidales bacterium]